MGDDSSVSEKLAWWVKHKNKIYGAILLVVGLLGGNADRVADMVPTLTDPKIEARIISLEADVSKIKAKVWPKPVDEAGEEEVEPEFKVER